MCVQTQVFARPESTSQPGRMHPNLFRFEGETAYELLMVDVDPL